ncbi:Hypothetical_protein [Hexamita inflata]|uniref:Hypothetical_protein n=1 Tax=Hexamita inflata TaxID=28002 RepID=A0AA86PGF1_9EUKA|nr:Hypothetical protein HINF_LOCUS26464 [Hexamita inflata]
MRSPNPICVSDCHDIADYTSINKQITQFLRNQSLTVEQMCRELQLLATFLDFKLKEQTVTKFIRQFTTSDDIYKNVFVYFEKCKSEYEFWMKNGRNNSYKKTVQKELIRRQSDADSVKFSEFEVQNTELQPEFKENEVILNQMTEESIQLNRKLKQMKGELQTFSLDFGAGEVNFQRDITTEQLQRKRIEHQIPKLNIIEYNKKQHIKQVITPRDLKMKDLELRKPIKQQITAKRVISYNDKFQYHNKIQNKSTNSLTLYKQQKMTPPKKLPNSIIGKRNMIQSEIVEPKIYTIPEEIIDIQLEEDFHNLFEPKLSAAAISLQNKRELLEEYQAAKARLLKKQYKLLRMRQMYDISKIKLAQNKLKMFQHQLYIKKNTIEKKEMCVPTFEQYLIELQPSEPRIGSANSIKELLQQLIKENPKEQIDQWYVEQMSYAVTMIIQSKQFIQQLKIPMSSVKQDILPKYLLFLANNFGGAIQNTLINEISKHSKQNSLKLKKAKRGMTKNYISSDPKNKITTDIIFVYLLALLVIQNQSFTL